MQGTKFKTQGSAAKRSKVLSRKSFASNYSVWAAAVLGFVLMVCMMYNAIVSDLDPRKKQICPVVAFEQCGDDELRVEKVRI
jgi:hypothetical protein